MSIHNKNSLHTIKVIIRSSFVLPMSVEFVLVGMFFPGRLQVGRKNTYISEVEMEFQKQTVDMVVDCGETGC